MDKVKTLLLNHGEKLVAGIVALLAFMALTSASWEPNTDSPNDLIEITRNKKAEIERNDWPAEDKTMFEDLPDVESMVTIECRSYQCIAKRMQHDAC